MSKNSLKDNSPEAHFILTGEIIDGFDSVKAKKLAENFLAEKWTYHGKKHIKKGNLELPLPQYNEMLSGTKLTKKDRKLFIAQVDFAAKIFCRHLSAKRKSEIKKILENSLDITSQTIFHNLISSITDEKNPSKDELLEARQMGKTIYKYMKKYGHIGGGVIHEKTGKMNLAKGFSESPYYSVTPIHEAIHRLQQLRVIKMDVPFAEAVDAFYALEHGIMILQKKKHKKIDFDRKPKIKNKSIGYPNYFEPEWSYDLGKTIGEWLHKNYPGQKGWDYLYIRSMGEKHASALRIIKSGKFQRYLKQLKKTAK
ncbi:MAG: hypothetical protein COV47_01775 [Candidatus Diapherotrites archaeon CG11_big_fil_rev_8_21_14_0_20_37_9]|nr:MAG: hypothetical protein COV47_01775 [Candidatus Diapherotrites archaeon CG11_big_fil_rev_8_21_14_0_20_37_9]